MRASKISWGIVFIFIGTVFLLENYDIIDFSWGYIWRFWPLILIVTGINIIFSKSNSNIAKWLVIVTTVFALGLLVYANMNTPKTLNRHWSYNFDDDVEEETATAIADEKSFYQENYDARFKTATLNINGGASTFTIINGNKNLFESTTQKNNDRYYLRKTDTDSAVVLNFKATSKNNNFDFDDADLSTVTMKIHTAPLWDINLNMGAGTADFDLSNNRVKQVNIKGGAADFKIKIGELYNDVNLSAETGIAKVSILIPTASGCKINTKTGLSAKDFPGFEKADDGSFTSPNYASATNKIMIKLKGGLSDFEVKRY